MDKKISLIEGSDEFKVIIENLRVEMKNQNLETLPDFLKKLNETYIFDYGSICHIMSIASVATLYAFDHSCPQGGITGFQAGAIMWENIMNWMENYRGKPLKLINYDDMIYPQYANKFEKIMSANIWENLQSNAKEHIAKIDLKIESYISSQLADGKTLEEIDDVNFMHPVVEAHMRSIANGVVPFGYIIEGNEPKLENLLNKPIDCLGDLRNILKATLDLPDDYPITFTDSDMNEYFIGAKPEIVEADTLDDEEDEEDEEYEFGEKVVDADKAVPMVLRFDIIE